MADLRDRVTEDRGLLKKIQMAIPGYRGYRIREDLRIADSMLRLQIADRMRDEVLKPLEETREVCSRELELDVMNDMAAVISAASLLIVFPFTAGKSLRISGWSVPSGTAYPDTAFLLKLRSRQITGRWRR